MEDLHPLTDGHEKGLFWELLLSGQRVTQSMCTVQLIVPGSALLPNTSLVSGTIKLFQSLIKNTIYKYLLSPENHFQVKNEKNMYTCEQIPVHVRWRQVHTEQHASV